MKQELKFPPNARCIFDEAYFNLNYKDAETTLKLIEFMKPKKLKEEE